MLTKPKIGIDIELRRLHPSQQKILDESKRFNVLCMGRRWGKSTLGQFLVSKNLGSPIGWFAPTYKLLDEAFRQIIRSYQPVIIGRNASSKRIQLVTGGSIDFWSLDNPDTVARGRAYRLVVVDEAAMAPYLEDAWQQSIRPTLTDLQGSAWFLSTPKGLNFFHELWHRSHTDDAWASWQLPTLDNPHISPEEIEAARLELPDIVFSQEYLAQFVTMEGGRVKKEWLRYGPPPPDGIERVMAVDLAISTKTGADYTAAAVISKMPDGSIYVHDVQRARLGFADVLQFIQTMAQKWRPRQIGIEQVQYQAAVVEELLRRTSLPVRGIKPDRDKLSRFQPLEARYQQGLIVHSRNLPREFEEELLSFPFGPHDDMVDSLAYAYSLVRHGTMSENARRAFSEV